MPTRLTRTDAAELLGISPRHFDQQIRRLLPAEAITGEGKSLRFDGKLLVETWTDYRIKQTVKFDPDALMGSDDDDEEKSPSLDRLRSAKADLAEMERDTLRGLLIPREELDKSLPQFAAVIRRAGEMITRQFGNDAGGILNDAITECEASWQKMLESPKETEADPRDPQPEKQHGPR